MAGCIARIAGHDLREDRVRTLVLLSIAGNSAKEVIKEAGVTLAKKATTRAINRVPGRALIDINKKVGFRLITKAGERGIINLTKMVPIVGGLVCGGADAAASRTVGYTAKRIFFSGKFPDEADATVVP